MKRGMFLVLALFVALTSGARLYRPSHPVALGHSSAALPLAYFWGIAGAESSFDPLAIGLDGHDRGLWQYRDLYDAERGLVNAFDPVESTRLAAKEFQEHLAALGSVELAVTAHKRGKAGARLHGVDREYLAKVKAWGYE
jgi:hypothetical protein